jgi:hypothetical protein
MLQCRKFFRLGNHRVFTHPRPEADIAGAANRPFESPPSRRDSSHDDWDASAQFPFHDSVADFIHDQIFVVEQNRLRGAPPTVLLILRQILRRRRPAEEASEAATHIVQMSFVRRLR